MRRFLTIKIALLFVVFLPPVEFLDAQDSPAVEYLRYDVEITLAENGDLAVREIQQVRYGGEFSEGFAEIPLEYVTDITDVGVYGGPDLDHLSAYELGGTGANSYSFEREGNNLYVDWTYEPTTAGDELTFVVEYLVKGGLWIYPDADLLEWRAVPADRSGIAVAESQVTVNFPFALASDDLGIMAFGPEYSTFSQETAEGQQVIFTIDEPLPDGTPLQILIDFPHGLVDSIPQAWQLAEEAADLVYRIPTVEVELALDESGNLHVREELLVRVVEGTMYEGYRRFNWLFLEGLDQLYVREGEVYYEFVEGSAPLSCEDCFNLNTENRYAYWISYDKTEDEIEINDFASGGGVITWRFPPLVKGEEATFVIEFDAIGTLSVNEEDQTLHWTILPGYDVPVEKTTARLSLPGSLGLEDVTIQGAGTQEADDGDILLTLDEPATDWSIQVTLPPGTTSAEKTSWQTEMEAVYQEAEAYRERVAQEKVIFGTSGLLLLVLAVLSGLVVWYLKGSRRWREIRGNYRTTPPSDLAPGLVAYLVDEKATAHGVLATLLHLATLGLIRVQINKKLELERICSEEQLQENANLETPIGEKVQIMPHIAFLYNSLASRLPVGDSVALDELINDLQKLMPDLYAKMGQDFVTLYHKKDAFQGSSKLPKLLFITNLMLFIGLFVVTGPVWSFFFVTPFPIAFFIVFMVICLLGMLAWWIFSSLRVQTLSKSAKLQAKRWLGFKAYLQDIERYGDLAEAQEILDRYMDYAVALGVDDRLVEQAERMGGVIPIWLGKGFLDDGTVWESEPTRIRPRTITPWYRRGSWTGRPAGRRGSNRSLADDARSDGRPPLQRLSDDLTGSISTASQSLTSVLNTAVGEGDDPVKVKISAFGSKTEMEWKPDTPVDQVIGDIMRKSQTLQPPRPARSSGGGFRGGGGSSFRGSSRSSSRSRSRSSSSRRSGGGGRRGFR